MAEPNMMDDMLAGITKEVDKAEKKLKDKEEKKKVKHPKLKEVAEETPSGEEILKKAGLIDWVEVEKGDLIQFVYGAGAKKQRRLVLVLDPIFLKRTKMGSVKMMDGLQFGAGTIQHFGPQRILQLAKIRKAYRTYKFKELRKVTCRLIYSLDPDLMTEIWTFLESKYGRRKPRVHPGR
jgi:hypothetical protein|tara:strand:- start:251 stop:787 length:537 start_codon:yes stop_codon:yes gene_type:complete